MTIGLYPEMMYRVQTTHPLDPTEGSPLGVTQYWQVTEAELTGDRIDAKLAATGGDWMQMSSDGFWRPNVRAQFETNDGAIVLMQYWGLVEQTEAFKLASEADRETQCTINICALRFASTRALNVTAGSTRTFSSQPEGCSGPAGSNTPSTG
jgi:Protein of unknown function (DUF3237)